MELVRPVYFMHIPKTAGTSVHRFLADALGDDIVSPPMLWDSLVGEAAPGADRWKVWVGHFSGLFPLWLGKWPIIFTVLRDPIARSISHINHVQRVPEHPLHEQAKGLSVAEYCASPRLLRTVENYQARYLASLSFSIDLMRPNQERAYAAVMLSLDDDLWALDRGTGLLPNALRALDHIDVVGISEASCAFLERLSQALEIPAPAGEYRLNTAGAADRSAADLSPADLEALRLATEIDQVVYEAAIARFRGDCERHGIRYSGLPLSPNCESLRSVLRDF